MTEQIVRRTLIAIGIALLVSFSMVPVLYMLVTSLGESANFLSGRVQFNGTLRNYHEVIFGGSLHFPRYLLNSFVVSLGSAVLAVAVAALAGYAIARIQIRGRLAILLGALAASMFPQISLVGYLFRFMTEMGWINTYLALIFPYIALVLPLSLWILTSYFSQIPRELDRAALVDGCSRWQVFRLVILPIAAPGVVSTALLAFIFSFNEFMFALILTSDHHARTIPVGIALFQGLHGETPWGTIMAASFVSITPIILLTLAFQRQIVTGLTRGAVKG